MLLQLFRVHLLGRVTPRALRALAGPLGLLLPEDPVLLVSAGWAAACGGCWTSMPLMTAPGFNPVQLHEVKVEDCTRGRRGAACYAQAMQLEAYAPQSGCHAMLLLHAPYQLARFWCCRAAMHTAAASAACLRGWQRTCSTPSQATPPGWPTLAPTSPTAWCCLPYS